ncbi:MAG: RDD family protein, partial [Vicinamibacterales bacterium]
TLKFCGLTYAEVRVLPVAPFAAFLLLLNGGYLAAFTAAGGQSIGKMLGRIRVVPSDPEGWSDRVPLGQAVLRAVGYFVSALPLGLGFLPALVGSDKRAFHDRLAQTRVVKA